MIVCFFPGTDMYVIGPLENVLTREWTRLEQLYPQYERQMLTPRAGLWICRSRAGVPFESGRGSMERIGLYILPSIFVHEKVDV